MDDDGRSGRWMARGNMGKLTHLEAFTSDDGKRERVWRGEWMDGNAYFKRIDDDLWIAEEPNGPMRICDEQVAAMKGSVTWADEPKTLTPQEALRALADGECVQSSRFIYRLVDREICVFNPGRTPVWFPITYFYRECHIVPDPSQQAEPIKAPLKVGDRVKRGPDWKWGSQDNSGAGSIIAGARPAGDGWLWVKWDDGAQEVYRYGAEGKYDIEKIEAEPQVEYPLTYAEAEALARRGAHVTNEMFPHVTYAVIDSVPRLRTNKGGWFGDDWVTTRSEEVAKWRIVDGGK